MLCFLQNDYSLEPFPEEKFESSDVHICLQVGIYPISVSVLIFIFSHCMCVGVQVNHNGPVLYHIHQWVGEIANASVRTSGDAHCELLYRSLPSRPVIHRHVSVYHGMCIVPKLLVYFIVPGSMMVTRHNALLTCSEVSWTGDD